MSTALAGTFSPRITLNCASHLTTVNRSSYGTLKEITSLGFIEAVPVKEVLDESVEIEIVLSLFASDAVYLATVMMNQAALIAEDSHLLNRYVVEYAQRKNTEITTLREKIW